MIAIGVRMFAANRRVDEEQSRHIDMLRGGSALAVLIGHTLQIFGPTDWYLAAGYVAQAAVMIFFVISGFFIHKSLISHVSRGSVISFVEARVNRIIPPFLCSLILTALLAALAPSVFASGSRAFAQPVEGLKEFSLSGFVPTMFFLNGFVGPTIPANNPLWSLTFEVWYYAVFLLVSLSVLRRRLDGIVGFAVFATLTWLNHAFVILSLPWMLGVIASVMHSNRLFVPKQGIALAIAVTAFLVTPVVVPSSINLTVWRLMAGVVAFLYICRITEKTPGNLHWLSAAATWSYSLYIFHMPILLGAYGISPTAGTGATACTGAIVFAALVGRRLEMLRVWPSASSR